MLRDEQIGERLSDHQRLEMMRIDRRAPRSSKLPPLLRFSLYFPISITHWDQVSIIRTHGCKRRAV